ncbi:MAG: pirin family protein [Pseudomonadota bacterium]|nr:pirin family protein [Pseudomonadota bacterium]
MSWMKGNDPVAGDAKSCDALDMVIVPRTADIGGFTVRRALPSARRRMVGPFIFFDEMGPGEFLSGQGLDVRPHPHIGLATVTYLFEGSIDHRDSLGTHLTIRPGDVNWMTAGRGIAHSERTGAEVRKSPSRLAGIQSWVALPKSAEESAPAFFHHGKSDLPVVKGEGKTVRLVLGSLYGERSPVEVFNHMFYADALLEPGARLPLPADHEERAVYVVSGEIDIAGDVFEAGRLLIFRPGDEITMTARIASRVMLLGGEAADGPRYIWWNFVSSSKERIEQAKADWKQGRFDPVPGDAEFIPLPDK